MFVDGWVSGKRGGGAECGVGGEILMNEPDGIPNATITMERKWNQIGIVGQNQLIKIYYLTRSKELMVK